MRLSNVERLFLSRATTDAAQSLPKLAAVLGVSDSKLRYAVDCLTQKGVIRVMPHIDRSCLGLTDFHVFFSISAKSETLRARFIRQLCLAQGLVFLAELGGDFQYEAIISSRSAIEAFRVLDDVATNAQIGLRRKSIASNVAMLLFSKRYLESAAPGGKALRALNLVKAQTLESSIELEDTDVQLLRYVSSDGSASLRALGKALGISHATVQYRLQRLKKLGVLQGFYYDVEPVQYGYHDFVWQLAVAHNRKALEKEILNVAAACSAVSYVATYFGEWDFELGIEVAQPRLINGVLQHLSELLGPEFISVRLLLRFDQLALRHYPF